MHVKWIPHTLKILNNAHNCGYVYRKSSTWEQFYHVSQFCFLHSLFFEFSLLDNWLSPPLSSHFQILTASLGRQTTLETQSLLYHLDFNMNVFLKASLLRSSFFKEVSFLPLLYQEWKEACLFSSALAAFKPVFSSLLQSTCIFQIQFFQADHHFLLMPIVCRFPHSHFSSFIEF